MKLPATLRALRYRNFQLFFGGQLISLIGTWMQNVAQAWLVYRLTGSSVLLGVVGFAGQIPVFLLSPAGRHRGRPVQPPQGRDRDADRVDGAGVRAGGADAHRARCRSGTSSCSPRCSAWSTRSTFRRGRRSSWTWSGRDDLMNAIALNSSMFNASRIVGPAIAGILVASIGEGWCFFANAVSYIAVIAGLLMMKRHAAAARLSAGLAARAYRRGLPLRRAQSRPMRALLILLGLVSLTGMPYAVLMPIFADQILHGGAAALGCLMGASGVGRARGRAAAGDAAGRARAGAVGGGVRRRLRRRPDAVCASRACSGSRPRCWCRSGSR